MRNSRHPGRPLLGSSETRTCYPPQPIISSSSRVSPSFNARSFYCEDSLKKIDFYNIFCTIRSIWTLTQRVFIFEFSVSGEKYRIKMRNSSLQMGMIQDSIQRIRNVVSAFSKLSRGFVIKLEKFRCKNITSCSSCSCFCTGKQLRCCLVHSSTTVTFPSGLSAKWPVTPLSFETYRRVLTF